MSDDLFTAAAAAVYVGVSRQAVDDRRERKRYVRIEVSGKPFYERWWLDEWKNERKAKAEETLAHR